MTDLVTLIVRAGKGGDGRVSFRREKYVLKGGPDGGKGGDGGNLIVRGSDALATLKHFAGTKEFAAQAGQPGGRRKKIGGKGEDLVLEVPVGTTIWLLGENRTGRKRRVRFGMDRLLPRDSVQKELYHLEKEGQTIPSQPKEKWFEYYPEGFLQNPGAVSAQEFKKLKDLVNQTHGDTQGNSPTFVTQENLPLELYTITQAGEEIVLCQGGLGGRGNESFKSGSQTTPLVAEYGSPGEERVVILEQRLLADVGLVGFPSAGKSTLLSVLTKARPKIADYPFTTLEPHLGVMTLGSEVETQQQVVGGRPELVIADIPGLIEGASQGKGLGYDFLRHVENCSVLLYVLSLSEEEVFATEISPEKLAQLVWEQFMVLQHELRMHSEGLLHKPYLVSINKVDFYPEELQLAIQNIFKQKNESVRFFSAATTQGIDELRQALFSSVTQV